jgi:quinohemoprotein amine dehydrogenase
MQIEKTGDDEYTTKVNLTSVQDGAKLTRTGKSVAYGGTAWRARSAGSSAVSSPDDPNNDAREVMWFSADHATAEGRWFWGQYQEFGFDVKLTRATPNPTLLLTDRLSLKAGSRGNRLRLIGENLPSDGLGLGAGVTVRRIVSKSPTDMIAEVDVAANAPSGKRDIRLRTAILPAAIAIYDRIDYIQVTPESGTASFGDRTHPRGFLQFEAMAYQRGPDGKMHTDDDLPLGPVAASWNIEIFHAAPGSNADVVGRMSATGLLSPATVNPNVNFDTWVTATTREESLTGKAYTVVAIPTYAFNGRQYVRDLDRWIDDGPAAPGRGQTNRPPRQ